MATFFHHRLNVYKKTIAFIVAIDPVVGLWPSYRAYLISQMRRAASSIALNIAEAAYEIAVEDKRRLFRYARRSAGECVSVLDVAVALKLMTAAEAQPFYDQLNEIIAMPTGLTRPKV